MTWSRPLQVLISADPAPAASSPALQSAGPAGGHEAVRDREELSLPLLMKVEVADTLLANRSSWSFFMLDSSSDRAFWSQRKAPS